MKKTLTITIILVLFLGGCSKNINSSQSPLSQKTNQDNSLNKETEIILFYSNACPHCKRVESFIKNNNIDKKIKFQQKEINKNLESRNELIEKARQCNISPKNIGVPFLWDNGKCLMGDKDIINFFEEKING